MKQKIRTNRNSSCYWWWDFQKQGVCRLYSAYTEASNKTPTELTENITVLVLR